MLGTSIKIGGLLFFGGGWNRCAGDIDIIHLLKFITYFL